MLENTSFIVGLCVGFVFGVCASVALSFPRVARSVGKFAAVVLIGCGVGLITWGVLSGLNRESFEPLKMAAMTFYTPGQILGWGAGLLGSGITALVLSFVGKRAN